MTEASPKIATVRTAIKDEIDAVNPAWGTVLETENPIDTDEGEIEFIELYKQGSGANEGSIDLWTVRKEAQNEIEGEATGENYALYQFACDYWNTRVNAATWEADADAEVEKVVDRLTGNASVFAIGGQRQLLQPEIAQVASQGMQVVGGQYVYKARVLVTVEARRWS